MLLYISANSCIKPCSVPVAVAISTPMTGVDVGILAGTRVKPDQRAQSLSGLVTATISVLRVVLILEGHPVRLAIVMEENKISEMKFCYLVRVCT